MFVVFGMDVMYEFMEHGIHKMSHFVKRVWSVSGTEADVYQFAFVRIEACSHQPSTEKKKGSFGNVKEQGCGP